jgi:penicillin-binding protein 1A
MMVLEARRTLHAKLGECGEGPRAPSEPVREILRLLLDPDRELDLALDHDHDHDRDRDRALDPDRAPDPDQRDGSLAHAPKPTRILPPPPAPPPLPSRALRTRTVPMGVPPPVSPTSPVRPEEKPKPRRRLRTWLLALLIVTLVLATAAVVALALVVEHFEAGLPSVTDLRGNYHPPQVTRVLARDGTLLAELFTERRTVVPIASLPPQVKLAILAAEDAAFYDEHDGLNYYGIARAFLVNLRARRTRQGGSTITQQVVKNLLLDPERTYARKIREALLAKRLEQTLTKDEILELYLNHIYFGHGRYGIEEAARDNFGKSAKDLSVAEAALLAGLVAGPEAYSPRKDVTKALARRAYVLSQMLEKGFLNEAQYAAAKDEPVHLAPEVELNTELAPEVVEIARKTLRDLEKERAARGGYTITTTLDPRLQAAARKSVRDDLDAYDKRHGVNGPLLGPLTDKRNQVIRRTGKGLVPFEGTPQFDTHKVLVGEVTEADDARGTFDVRVGTVTGTVKLADYERYNPAKLPASAFAEAGAYVRVSLLAPVPAGVATFRTADGKGEAVAKVPLRLELGPEAALVAVDVRTREILALIGSYEGTTGGLDRATQARRQPGSTFKPIVYSYAIHSRRFTPASLIDVRPAAFEGGYKPANYEGWTASDPLRLREALANSVNVVAVRVLADVGPANVVEWGHALGIRSMMKPDLSLALGSYEVLPTELCGAYVTFAAGGEYEEPRLITRIVGPDGKDVPLDPPVPSRRVLDPAEAYVTTSLLTSVVDHGTGVAAKRLGRPLAGKTGTSNQSKDAWFAGYSTDLAAVVWVGYDDGKPLGASETGASAALPAWAGFMKAAEEKKPASEFPRPGGVTTVTIDTHTGALPLPGDPDTMEEIFLEGTQPTSPDLGDAGMGVGAGDAGVAAGDAEVRE